MRLAAGHFGDDARSRLNRIGRADHRPGHDQMGGPGLQGLGGSGDARLVALVRPGRADAGGDDQEVRAARRGDDLAHAGGLQRA